MGLRFRKSVKIAPGVRLNFGKKSSSVSFGGKGARYTVSTTGRRTATVGLPGTGLSYSETYGGRKSTSTKPESTRQGGNMKKQNTTTCKNCGAVLSKKAKVCAHCRTKVKKPLYKKWWVWILVISLLGSCGGKEEEAAAQNNGLGSNDVAVVEGNAIEQNVPEETPVIVVPEEVEDPVSDIEPAPIVETPIETQHTSEETPVVVPPIEEPTSAEEPVEAIVYVTNTGEKYHRENCQYLSKSKIPKPLSEAERFYEPCKKCKP